MYQPKVCITRKYYVAKGDLLTIHWKLYRLDASHCLSQPNAECTNNIVESAQRCGCTTGVKLAEDDQQLNSTLAPGGGVQQLRYAGEFVGTGPRKYMYIYIVDSKFQAHRLHRLTISKAVACPAHKNLIDENDQNRCGHIAEPGCSVHDQLFVLSTHGSATSPYAAERQKPSQCECSLSSRFATKRYASSSTLQGR